MRSRPHILLADGDADSKNEKTLMKKILFSAAMLLFGMTACQKVETSLDATNGDVQVTVATTLPAQMAETRVAGDGTTVDRCIMEIYLDGKLYGERQYADVQDLKATFSARLVTGETYDLVFWADKKGTDLKSDLHYNTADFSNVTFAEGDAYLGNDDARDAFFGSAQVVADQSKAVSVELRRPFGQLNVKTLDMAEVAAAAATLVPTKVKIAFDNVYTGIDLLSGELTGSTSAVAYADAVALAGTDGSLTVDYVFAPEGEQYLTDFTMSFLDANKVQVAADYEFTNIPVQRNYRTNVSGNLLTKKADINVEVKPGFDGDLSAFDDGAINTTTGVIYESLVEALAAAHSGETILAGGLETVTEAVTVPAGVTLDGSSSMVISANIYMEEGSTLSNLKVESDIHRVLHIKASNVTVDNVDFEYTGSESRSEGVSLYENVKNVTIKNSTFTGYWKAIYVGNGAENLSIGNNLFTDMNPFSMDQWFPSLKVEGNTFTGNTPVWRAIHITIAAGTEGMAGTTKYQESWPLALKQSVYDIFSKNTFENAPYMRLTCVDGGWDYKDLYFSFDAFNSGNLDNAHNAFTQRDRFSPSEVLFLDSYQGESNVVEYILDSRTNQANRGSSYSSHFYNTQGRHFEVFNPSKITTWEVTGKIYVDAQMIADQKPFRSELWTSANNAETDEAQYPMLGIANVVEDAGGIYQSTMDHAVVRVWNDNGWTNVEGVTVNAGWHTVKLVSDGSHVTYFFDDAEVGKMSEQAAPTSIKSIMPEAFHYDYQHTDGRWFYQGYTCETYFCGIQYTLGE